MREKNFICFLCFCLGSIINVQASVLQNIDENISSIGHSQNCLSVGSEENAFCLKAWQVEGQDYFSVSLVEGGDLVALNSYNSIPIQIPMSENIEEQNLYCDLTAFPDNINCSLTYHDIRNAGYVHCSEKHHYDYSTFGFGDDACVTLSGPSALV